MYDFYKGKIKTDNSFKDFIYQNKIINEIKNILSSVGKPLFCDTYINYNELKDYYFPYYFNVFRFLENDIMNLKYIILGMDPYPSFYIENKKIIPIATGRSFEVSNIEFFSDKYKQVSLRNIIKTFYYDKYNLDLTFEELRNKIINIKNKEVLEKINDIIINNKNSNFKKQINEYLKQYEEEKKFIIDNDKIVLLPSKNFFDITEKEGILWLNATLTVRPNEPNSHTSYYLYFMTELIKYIHFKNNKIKWLVWGLNAKNRISSLIPKENIIYCCHPATRVNNDFVTKNCFKEMKDIFLYY